MEILLKESDIDLTVGLVLRKKHGDAVQEGDILAVIHANDKDKKASDFIEFYI